MAMNCGECLVNNVKLVNLVDMVCPECKADYRDVRDFLVAAVIPDTARRAAPKAAGEWLEVEGGLVPAEAA